MSIEAESSERLFWQASFIVELIRILALLPNESYAVTTTSSLLVLGAIPPRVLQSGIRDIDIWVTNEAWKLLYV